MPQSIVVDRDEVARIARAHDVRRLQVFGSAVSGKFDATKSDVDLLVELDPDVDDPFDAYFALKEDLEALFARPVDLVMADAIRNPHFRERVLATAEDLYTA
ncbi:MAG TPA: nucleotidyltransferase domain-containing protein [Microbacterium sp.]|uniref:nucleotidyltransferase family protein n=1 Tax=Microbacterium sp. TaxID=51671 RepID=UPI002B46CB14|nr:nucleotidyltransferase domain-containing protein [Microbacterium sp.]HKT56621.1 nucleotidyltransferase domain-containing protein [Microbacterium sp.]